MFSYSISRGFSRAILFSCMLLVCSELSASAQSVSKESPPSLHFVRAFSSPSDLKPEHEILNRTLDIVAGPADPSARMEDLKSPVALTTDSTHRVFVADTASSIVHIFDLTRSKYARLDAQGNHLHNPVALGLDPRDNLYVVDQISRAIFVYDSEGKFRRSLGRLRGGESYFEGPTGIAIDRASGRIFVCDRLAHMIFEIDSRGKILRRIGKRGGGEGPGEFRLPTEVAVDGGELYVLDAGNHRIQILDLTGHFRRAISVGYAGHGAGLAVDAHHNIYLSDPSLNQIQVFAHDGRSLRVIDITTIKGANFTHPSAMWIDEAHNLYVIDDQENRIGEFELSEEKP